MDLLRAGRIYILLASSTLVLSACDMNKSNKVTSRFPDSDKKQEADECGAQYLKEQAIITWMDGSQSLENVEDLSSFKKGLENNIDQIQWVEYNRKIEIKPLAQSSTAVPASDVSHWGITASNAQAAWTAGHNGSGAVVAVVDQPVDYTHPQLETSIYVNTNETPDNEKDDDGNGYIDDYYGWDFANNVPLSTPPSSTTDHGTHVAGIIAADSAKGDAQGIAPGAKIIAASFISEKSSGDVFSAIKAMEYSIDRGAKVINASWGGEVCSVSLKSFMSGEKGTKVLFVVAAGNAGKNLDDPTTREYPAAFSLPNQLTVVAESYYVGMDRKVHYDAMASFSNYGRKYTHLAAPGADILSTAPKGSTATKSGTSMATPFVTGAAAILVGAYPNASVDQIRTALMKSVDTASIATESQGTLNVQAALDWLKNNSN